MCTDTSRSRLGGCLAVTLLFALGAAAHAQVGYRYEAHAASVEFVPGGPTVLDIYLRETRFGPGPGLSDRGGLFGAGFGVRLAGGGTLPIVSIAGNPVLFGGFTSVELTPTWATFLQAVPLSAVSGALPDSSGRLLLGRVTLGPSATALPVTFEIWRRDNFGGNTVAFDGTDLDLDSAGVLGAVAPTYVMVYATIPEPSALAGALALTLLLRRPSRPLTAA